MSFEALGNFAFHHHHTTTTPTRPATPALRPEHNPHISILLHPIPSHSTGNRQSRKAAWEGEEEETDLEEILQGGIGLDTMSFYALRCTPALGGGFYPSIAT